jgi:hypothetical protein
MWAEKKSTAIPQTDPCDKCIFRARTRTPFRAQGKYTCQRQSHESKQTCNNRDGACQIAMSTGGLCSNGIQAVWCKHVRGGGPSFRTEPVRGRPKIIDRFSQNDVIGDRHVGKEVESKLVRYSESSGVDTENLVDLKTQSFRSFVRSWWLPR